MFGLNPDTPEKMLQWAASPPPDFNFPSFPLDKDNVWQIPAPITYHHITHEWMQVMSNRLTGAEQGVPKIIHQIWFDRDSGQGRPRVLMNSCKVRNPGWDHRILNLCNTKDLSQDRQSPHQTGFVLEDSLKLRGWPTSLLNLLSSDIIRIELLYRYGGVYIDADVLCLKSLDYLIPMIEGELSFAWEKSDWSLVANGIMIGFQYSWALLRVLEHYLKLQFFVHGGQLPNPWMDTGPLFFWKKIVQPAFCLPVQCIHQDFASQSSAFMKTPPPRLQDEISWSGDAHNQYCWSDISTTVLAARVFYPYQHAEWADGLHKKDCLGRITPHTFTLHFGSEQPDLWHLQDYASMDEFIGTSLDNSTCRGYSSKFKKLFSGLYGPSEPSFNLDDIDLSTEVVMQVQEDDSVDSLKTNQIPSLGDLLGRDPLPRARVPRE